MFLLADAGAGHMLLYLYTTVLGACWAWDRKRMDKRIDTLEAKLKLLEAKIPSPEPDDAAHAALR